MVLATGQGGATYEGTPVILICAALAFLIQWLAFIPAAIFQTEKFYDLTGGLTYITVVAVALILTHRFDSFSLTIAGMVIIWATRLGGFLFIRIIKDGADNRFDEIKPDLPRFFATWTIQGLWVTITAAAALTAIASPVRVEPNWLVWTGLVIWYAGFLIESIADRQKRVFRKANPDRTAFIQSGLWAYSRHPNYLGEIILWFGIAIAAIPALSGWQYVALISPLFVTLLLTRVSGIPLLEAKATSAGVTTPTTRHTSRAHLCYGQN